MSRNRTTFHITSLLQGRSCNCAVSCVKHVPLLNYTQSATVATVSTTFKSIFLRNAWFSRKDMMRLTMHGFHWFLLLACVMLHVWRRGIAIIKG